MPDDLKDIDPVIVEKVLEHADVFIDVDKSIDDVVEWGEQELQVRQQAMESEGSLTPESLKDAAAVVEAEVRAKLKSIESEVQTKYGQAA